MSNISSFIDLNSNKFMTITFTKKDGTERTINGRLNVTKHLAGGKRTLDDSFIIIYSTIGVSGVLDLVIMAILDSGKYDVYSSDTCIEIYPTTDE